METCQDSVNRLFGKPYTEVSLDTKKECASFTCMALLLHKLTYFMKLRRFFFCKKVHVIHLHSVQSTTVERVAPFQEDGLLWLAESTATLDVLQCMYTSALLERSHSSSALLYILCQLLEHKQCHLKRMSQMPTQLYVSSSAFQVVGLRSDEKWQKVLLQLTRFLEEE